MGLFLFERASKAYYNSQSGRYTYDSPRNFMLMLYVLRGSFSDGRVGTVEYIANAMKAAILFSRKSQAGIIYCGALFYERDGRVLSV